MDMRDFFNELPCVEKTVEKSVSFNCMGDEKPLNLQINKYYALCPLSMKE